MYPFDFNEIQRRAREAMEFQKRIDDAGGINGFVSAQQRAIESFRELETDRMRRQSQLLGNTLDQLEEGRRRYAEYSKAQVSGIIDTNKRALEIAREVTASLNYDKFQNALVTNNLTNLQLVTSASKLAEKALRDFNANHGAKMAEILGGFDAQKLLNDINLKNREISKSFLNPAITATLIKPFAERLNEKWQEQVVRKTFDQPVISSRVRNYIDETVKLAVSSEIEEFEQTFVGKLTVEIKNAVVEADSKDDFDKRMGQVISTALEESGRTNLGQNTIYLIVTFVIATLLALTSIGISLYQIAESKQSGLEQSKKDELMLLYLKNISENSENADSDETSGIFYEVQRKTNLKLNPQPKAQTIGILMPGLNVKVGISKHKWVFVEYFDYIHGVPRYGWIDKKYLKRID